VAVECLDELVGDFEGDAVARAASSEHEATLDRKRRGHHVVVLANLPRRSYLICANQRSGSTLLCEALTGTGIAGRPEEYFLAADPATLPDRRFWEDGSPFAVEHDVHDRRSYLELSIAWARRRTASSARS
jgi:hypothetical protein